MPQANQLYLPQQLQGVAIQKGGTEHKYIADDIAPAAQSRKQSGNIFEIDPDSDLEREYDFAVAPGAEPIITDVAVSSDKTYNCRKYGVTEIVTDEEVENAEAESAPAIDKTLIGRDRLKRSKEIKFLRALIAGFTGARTTAVVDKWDDYDNANSPVDQILAKIGYVEGTAGVTPIGLACDIKTLRVLANHPDVIDRAKYTSKPSEQVANEAQMANLVAQVFGFKKVDYAKNAFINTSPKGVAAARVPIWGSYAFLYFTEPAKIQTQGAIIHVNWTTGAAAGARMGGGGVSNGMKVVAEYHPRRGATLYTVIEYYDQKVLNADAGHLFSGVLT